MKILKQRWAYHTLIWLMSYLVFVCIGYVTSSEPNIRTELFDPFIFLVPIIPITYIAFWAKARYFDSRQYILYTLSLTGTVVLGVFLINAMEWLQGNPAKALTQSVTNLVFIQFFAIGLQYFKRGIVNQYQLQEMKARTAMTELNALKAQLNPHFLFNTLNNIYGMNQLDAVKGSEMIMELSEVMRYHLEFSKVGKVKLLHEIQLLKSYIKLEKLRLRETCEVKTDFEEVDKGFLISPLLLIPFVENAFKHGTHPTKSCYVHVEIEVSKDKLHFAVKNSIIAERKVVKTNIGIPNVKRRLELLYPGKHVLNITQNSHEYFVDMYIEL